MTENEANEMLKAKLTCMELEGLACIEKGCSRNCDECDYNYAQGSMGEQKEAIKIAIGIFDEIQQYRLTGTVSECQEAMEKRRKRKPVKDEYKHDCCPDCGWIVCYDEWGGRYLSHCENCGQAIDWSE